MLPPGQDDPVVQGHADQECHRGQSDPLQQNAGDDGSGMAEYVLEGLQLDAQGYPEHDKGQQDVDNQHPVLAKVYRYRVEAF